MLDFCALLYTYVVRRRAPRSVNAADTLHVFEYNDHAYTVGYDHARRRIRPCASDVVQRRTQCERPLTLSL